MRNNFLLPVALAALCLASCGKSDNAPANTGNNITLTAEQRRNITLTTVTSGRFHRNVDTTPPIDCGLNTWTGPAQDRTPAVSANTSALVVVDTTGPG